MNEIVKKLDHWRNEDQADAIALSRHEIIALLEGIKRLHGAIDTCRQLREYDGKEIEQLRIQVRGGIV